MCAITLRSWIALLHFDLKYLMWGLNVNFLSKIIPRNLCSSTLGISIESNLRILWRLQKCIHCVLFLENLKPFLMVQLFILFRHCWSSIVLIYLDLQQIRKSSTYSEPSTPKFTMLFIFMLNKVTDKMLPCGTPNSCSCSSERVLPVLEKENF